MTKLSVHVSGTNRNGFGTFLQEPFSAESPIPLVFALNQNVWADILKYSPSTLLVYRDDRYGVDPFDDAFFTGTTSQAKIKGRSWVDLYASAWSKNPAHYYAFINEPGVHDANAYERYNAFSIGAMERAQELGYKLCLYEWSTGNPNLDLLNYLVPSLEMAKANGHLLGLHEYSLEGPMIADPPNELILRYRTLRGLLPESARCVFAITESGPGAGYGTGYRMQSYMNVVEPYDVEVMKDPYVLGVALFDYGNTESNMQEVMPLMTEYAVTHPTPEVPPEEEMLDIIVIENLVPPDTTKTEMDYVVNQTFPSRQDIQWSADTAKYLVQHALTGSKVIVWNPERWTQGDILAYLGVPTEIKYFPESDFRLANPVPSIPFRVTSLFDTPRNYANGKHEGLDLDGYDDVTGKTVPVVAGADGVVVTVVDRVAPNSYGRYVVIDHKNDYRTWYCHLSSTSVSVGQSVSKGQKIGVTGATGTSAIHLHLNLQHIGRGASGYFIPDVVDPLPYIDQGTVVPPVTTDTYIGLGYGNQDEIPQSHADLYGRSFSGENKPAFLFLTLPDYNAMTRTIQKIKQKTPNAFFMARMFFSVGNTPFTPQDFVNYTHNGTSSAYNNGIRDFQVGNEWNIEGMNLNWSNGVQFGNWLKEVLAILKPRYPDARFWYPALSPNAGSQTFLPESISTGVGDLLYGYCFHDYWWTESGGQYNMVDETGGLQHKKLQRVLPTKEQSKPISITEFSCNTPNVPNTEKGKQYRRYKSLLGQNGVHSAFSFVLNWATDNNKENWANSNGSSTGISEGFLSA